MLQANVIDIKKWRTSIFGKFFLSNILFEKSDNAMIQEPVPLFTLIWWPERCTYSSVMIQVG